LTTKIHQGKSLQYLIIEPSLYNPERSYPLIILLHGFGSHMGDLAGLCPLLDTHSYLYICPNAPLHIELSPGMQGYAWFPMGNEFTHESFNNGLDKITVFMKEICEKYDIQTDKIIFGGFSQGGMIAYHYGLSNPEMIRGVVALSSKIPSTECLQTSLPENRTQKIFISHGTRDVVIPVNYARRARQFLEDVGYQPTYKEYDMHHEISTENIGDLLKWLKDVIPLNEFDPEMNERE